MIDFMAGNHNLAFVTNVESGSGLLAFAGGIGHLGVRDVAIVARVVAVVAQLKEMLVVKRDLELPLCIGSDDGVAHFIVTLKPGTVTPPAPVPTALGEFQFHFGVGDGHTAVGSCLAGYRYRFAGLER